MNELLDSLFIIICTVVFLLIAYLAYKIPPIRYIFRFLLKSFVVLFSIVKIFLLIFMFSFFGFAVTIAISLYGNGKFLTYDGEPVHILLDPDPILILTISFGVFYFVIFTVSKVIYSLIKLNIWVYEALVLLTCSAMIILVFPSVVQHLFPAITVSIEAAFAYALIVVGMYMKETVPKRKKEEEGFSVRL
ncbi:hypothetical protein [Bacillus sp. FJAT-50079]|uniref:hypothetical protein n=1 Tax=Bacillus sp. FJAT-50079 TaxID=2833577 RepID=UPI001BC8FB1B|nr:hypothetical protein [Bacillus sp. FJAT-50079]MBS4207961.1 hypothetical protein [Bacillus sp. FJAT-50079]